MISCKCITYGRVEWLQEALHSFLIQDTDIESELIIVNDYPKQKLVFDHPKIKIFNLNETFNTIGEKENFAMSKCSGNTIVQFDDDDIALKNHLNNVTEFFTEDTDLLHWEKAVYYNEPNISAITGVGNSGIVFSRNIWEKVGHYPIENAGYDTSFTAKIHKIGKVVHAKPEKVSWFYRWGGGDYHMSGMGTDTPDRDNVVIRNSLHVEIRRRKGLIPIGKIHLVPAWKKRYDLLLEDYIKNNGVPV